MKYLPTTIAIGVVCTLFAINGHPIDSAYERTDHRPTSDNSKEQRPVGAKRTESQENPEPQTSPTNHSIIPGMPPMVSLVGVVEKWVDARTNAYELGLAPTKPAFHSLVEFGANQTGGPSGSTTVWEIRNWIPNASGDRNLIHTLRNVGVMKNILVSPAVVQVQKIASPTVSGTWDVQVRFSTSLHEWALNLATLESRGLPTDLRETGVGLVFKGKLISEILWAKLADKTNPATSVSDRWITVAAITESDYADNLVALLTP